MIERLKKSAKGKLFIQFIKFGMVGVSNTLLSLLITYAIIAFFKYAFQIETTWSLNIATTAGYIGGVCNSYYWNKKYVFQNRQETDNRKLFVKMFICYGATYLLSMVAMDILVIYMGIPHYIAPIPRLLITIPLNFAANKLWAFKDR